MEMTALQTELSVLLSSGHTLNTKTSEDKVAGYPCGSCKGGEQCPIMLNYT